MKTKIREQFITYLQFQRKCNEKSRSKYLHYVGKYEEHALESKGIKDVIRLESFPVAFEVLVGLMKKMAWTERHTVKVGYMMSVYWQFAHQNYFRERPNPFANGCGIKCEKFRDPRYISSRDPVMRKILSFPRTLRDRALVYVLYSSGIRAGEAIRLRIADISPQWVYVYKGKGNKNRHAPICPETYSYLQAQVEDIGRKGYNGEFVFPTFSLSGHIGENTLLRMFHRIRDRLELKELNPKMMRHSFATRMLENGAPLIDVMHWLGHEDIRTTTIYVHPSKEHLASEFAKYHQPLHPVPLEA